MLKKGKVATRPPPRDLPDRRGRGVCVLGDVGERLRNDEVGGRLNAGGEAVGADIDLHRQRHP